MSALVRRLAARLAPRVRPRFWASKPPASLPPVNVLRVAAGPEVAARARAELLQAIEVARAAPTPPPAPAPTGRWKGACPAVSYFTGKRCRLLSGHEGPHCDERREAFERALRPGEQPPYWHRIDSFANRRNHQEVP